ncbi:MAG TPA: glycosyltransferase family 39 protein [Verrucomicrobiae bacterium]|nr:glycosyltransferase family 39 protein [Verrucomicrobiae bacterium]
MKTRLERLFRSDIAVTVLIAAAFLLFHIVSNGKYGFHRDELQTLDDARHLDWGFVAYPPITPLIARFELILFGTSLTGFRFFAGVATSAVMVLSGLMAKELGGRRGAQVMAAVAAGITPVSLSQGAVFQYVSFDLLWGVALTYFLVRLLNSDDPRWWLAIGAAMGLGMETRYTMGFLALGVALVVLLTPARRYLKSGWLWAGAGLSVLLFLPNLVWQAEHHFISLEFLAHIHARDLREGRYSGFYPGQLLVCVNIFTAPLALLGLWFYFFRQAARRYRLLGWVFVATFALFAVPGARSYYTAPLYPMLLAGGSVFFGTLLTEWKPAWSRIALGSQWAGIIFGGIAFVLLMTPVAPVGSRIWKITSKMYDQFREEIGWPELAQAVAKVYDSLPPDVRENTGILTGNYGEGGALNLYGPPLGLPHAMCLTNSFWYRGFDPREPETVIVTGFDLDDAQELFDSCRVAAKNTNSFGVVNEESRDHPDILLCHKLRMPWAAYWSTHRRFG